MTWFTRFTRFGDMHLVYSQENANSCGIACVRMVVYKVNKIRLGSIARRSEKEYDKAYSAVSNTQYDGSDYSDALFLVKLLNQFTKDNWVCENAGPAGVAQKLIDSVGDSLLPVDFVGRVASIACSPVIVLVGWHSSGAHFVVIDTIHKIGDQYYASVCDPWDGDVHVTKFSPGTPFSYTAVASPTSWSLGSAEHSYRGAPSSGAGRGWIIRKA